MPIKSQVPDNRAAIEAGWKALRGRSEAELAELSGSRFSGGHILLPFFETRLVVDLRERTVSLEGREADASSCVLALHYLAGCGAETPHGDLVSFNQASGGEVYFEAFKHRTIERLAQEFGDSPSALVRAGLAIGGLDRELGSASVEVRVFPKFWVTVIVWQGDEEIQASANVLFDSTALDILPTEDLAVAGAMVVARLVKAKGPLS